jgi:D-alanyl-D-alanine carboxypeptidase/D-alanyl-D-alanine-endopeptidase (penicillin-binding protein 4)
MGWVRVAAVVAASGVWGAGLGQDAAGVGDGLGRQIAALVNDPAVTRAHWGVMVAGIDGTPIYELNAGQFFQPASNAKLFTTAAALALLGGGATVETRIVARGAMAKPGELAGDVALVGAGDANLSGRAVPYVEPKAGVGPVAGPGVAVDGLRYLEAMADQVAATGLKTVHGDVVGDDTLFPWEPYPMDWAIDDAVWGYGAPVSALSVNDNEIKLTVRPGAREGDPVMAEMAPAVPYYRLEVTAVTGTKGAPSALRIERALGSRVLRIAGVLAVDAPADAEEVAIEDPAEYAAMALKGMLEARGIVVTGVARALHRPDVDLQGFLAESRQAFSGPLTFPGPQALPGPLAVSGPQALHGETPAAVEGTVLARHVSPPLTEDVGVTNKLSLNLHAELLLRRLGVAVGLDRATAQGSSTAQGARVVRQFLVGAGVDPDDFVFYDGSGLSGHDLVTPRAVVRLLAYAAGQPWFGAYKGSLPVGGMDGSLQGRFAKTPLAGHVFAKTGTLGEARALSGYLECASGRTVVFSIMATDHAPGTSADRASMDKVVEAIAAAE